VRRGIGPADRPRLPQAAAPARGDPLGHLARRGDGGRSSISSASAGAAPSSAPRIFWPSSGCACRTSTWATEAASAARRTQYLPADALGLTAIHVSRVLRQLRERELLTFRDGRVVFHDVVRLRHLADQDGGYLDQNADPG
jgi:hypothetical protein